MRSASRRRLRTTCRRILLNWRLADGPRLSVNRCGRRTGVLSRRRAGVMRWRRTDVMRWRRTGVMRGRRIRGWRNKGRAA